MRVLSKFIFVLAVSLLGVTHLFAQAPDTAWTRTYGGSDDNDYGYSVQQTTDGGYIVAGYTYSYTSGSEDIYLIKTDSSGDTLWTRTYGGIDDDRGYSVQQTSDGGYIIAGETYSYGAGLSDLYLIRTNDLGDTLWTRIYGGGGFDRGYSVQQTSDGGYIVAGVRFDYVWLIKTNSLGDTLWTRIYGNTGGNSVQQTTDGGYIVAGTIFDAGSNDIYLIKTNGLGDTLWTKTYGGSDTEYGSSVQQTTDGGYIVAGETRSYGSYGDVYLIKTNSLGDTLWTKTFGRWSYTYDYGYSVQQTTDGGYIVAGGTSLNYRDDVYLIKTNSLGDTLWTKCTHSGKDTEPDDYYGYSVQQTTDGGYIVAGAFDPYGGGTYSDVYLMKIKPEGSGIEEKITSGLFFLSPADPNPFTTETTIRYELSKETNLVISVYNMLGQKIKNLYSGKQSSGIHEVTWNGTGNSGEKSSSGIYLLKVKVGEKEASRKVMFLR